MKYEVTFSCGHTQTVELFGAEKDRQRKIDWMETSCQCNHCQEQAISAKYDEKTVKYSEYKTIYSNCQTKKDSYDKANKTIVILVPKQETVVEKVEVEVETEVEVEKIIEVINEKVAEVEAATASDEQKAQMRAVIETTKEVILANLQKVICSSISEKLEQISTFAKPDDKYVTGFIKMIAKKLK